MVGLVLAMLASMLTNSTIGTALPTIMGVFVAGIPIAVLGLVSVSFLKGVPLRGGGPERRER